MNSWLWVASRVAQSHPLIGKCCQCQTLRPSHNVWHCHIHTYSHKVRVFAAIDPMTSPKTSFKTISLTNPEAPLQDEDDLKGYIFFGELKIVISWQFGSTDTDTNTNTNTNINTNTNTKSAHRYHRRGQSLSAPQASRIQPTGFQSRKLSPAEEEALLGSCSDHLGKCDIFIHFLSYFFYIISYFLFQSLLWRICIFVADYILQYGTLIFYAENKAEESLSIWQVGRPTLGLKLPFDTAKTFIQRSHS